MRIIGNDPSVPRQTQEVASGTLPNGKPVIVNADGTVSVAAPVTKVYGSVVTYSTANTNTSSIAYDSSNNKIVIAYADDSDSTGKAVVGTVDAANNSISFGTPVTFNSGITNYTGIVFDSNANKVVITYRDEGNNYYGTAIVGTVSGTSISFGSEVVFLSTYFENNQIDFDSTANKVVIIGSDGSNDYGKAFVGTVSGTSISFGSAVTFTTNNANNGMDIAYDVNANKHVLVYTDNSDSSKGKALVGTVSGTSISFGSAVEYSAKASYSQIVYNSTDNNVILAYRGGNPASSARARIGTVSGTSISFGTEAIVASTSGIFYLGLGYNPQTNNIALAYGDTGNSYYGTIFEGTISGTTLSFDSGTIYNENRTQYTAIAYDSTSNRFVLNFEAYGDSGKGKAFVIKSGFNSLTSENYIGISRSGAASGAGAIIDTQGAIADIPTEFYNLSSAIYDSKSFSTASQDSSPEEVRFKPDGTKFYILGYTNDTVYQYAMSTAWDVSTASYESKSFSVASQESNPQALAISSDGTKFYVAGQTDYVYQYTLSSAYDASTASYANKSFSTASQISGVPWGVDFDNTGAKMYVIGSGGSVFQYTLSTPWDVSTASYASKTLDTTTQTSDTTSVAISSDGLSLFVVSNGNDTVFKYTLSTAFDLSTASYSSESLNVSSQENVPYGVAVKVDGSKLYVTGTQNDSVQQYSTSTSLTAGQSYFVQTDGTLGTTAADPSVFAGTAVSATKLIVKG